MTTTQSDVHDRVAAAMPTRAWDVIEDAVAAGATGEITLATEAFGTTRVYLTNGSVYFAEHENNDRLTLRLIETGAVDVDQIERGRVRLNGVEHLGRLFEREPTIDRDAVELAVEMMTEQTLTDVAAEFLTAHRTAMYRQHSSGIARWFAPVTHDPEATTLVEVAPAVDATTSAVVAPAAEAASPEGHSAAVDALAVDTPPAGEGDADERMSDPGLVADDFSFDRAEPALSIPLIRVAQAAWTTPASPSATQTEVMDLAATIAGLRPTPLPTSLPTGLTPLRTIGPQPITTSSTKLAATAAATPVPDDVATAVRRAIAAIEAASGAARAGVTFGPLHVTSGGTAMAPDFMDDTPATAPPPLASWVQTPPTLSSGVVPSCGAFAPPAQTTAAPAAVPLSTERRNALRRLIGGLRRRH